MSLQNTRWEFNESIDFQGKSGTFQIYFETISGSNAFRGIRVDYSTQEIYYVEVGGDTLAYGYDDGIQEYAWLDSDLQRIKITGGTDVENTSLTSFITYNATELPIPTYNITYHLTKLSTVGAPSTIQEEATENFRLEVASGYEGNYRLPSNITVTGCDYNYAQGYVELYNAYGPVDIWAEAEEIAAYGITFNLTNLTHTGDTTIQEGGNATCYLVANAGYLLPTSIEVTGANYTYLRTTGEVYLTQPTGNITITARAGWQPSGVGVTLLRLQGERIRVDKSQYLTTVAEYDGALRDSCSITAPVIQIATSVLQPCNYAYIAAFGRYYYIDDIIAVRTGLWELHLSVDVLMTFRLGIKSSVAFVERNESTYDDLLIDKKRAVEQGETIQEYTIENELFDVTTGTFLLSGSCISIEPV